MTKEERKHTGSIIHRFGGGEILGNTKSVLIHVSTNPYERERDTLRTERLQSLKNQTGADSFWNSPVDIHIRL